MISFQITSIISGIVVSIIIFGIWHILSRPSCHVKIFFRDRNGQKKRYSVTFAGAEESGFIPIKLIEKTLAHAGFAGSTIDGVSMEYGREIITKSIRL